MQFPAQCESKEKAKSAWLSRVDGMSSTGKKSWDKWHWENLCPFPVGRWNYLLLKLSAFQGSNLMIEIKVRCAKTRVKPEVLGSDRNLPDGIAPKEALPS